MKSVRVVFALVGLLSLPLVAAEAQGQSTANKCKNTPQAGQNGNSQRGAAAVAAAQANKCPAPVPPPAPAPPPPPAPVPPPPPPPPAPVPPPPPPPPAPVPPPPPPPSSPPTGSNTAKGLVFEDVDGNGVWDKFGGEMGLAGWTVQLLWNGQVIASATTDANGIYQFGSLGTTTYEVCVVAQGGYTQTAPVNGSGCGGSGWAFPFASSSFPIVTMNLNFGQMWQ